MKYLLLSLLIISGCTNADKTVSTLQKSGFKNIKSGGYAWFACGKDDTWATNFTATNVNGQEVEGVVCCGLIFKGCTVRY